MMDYEMELENGRPAGLTLSRFWMYFTCRALSNAGAGPGVLEDDAILFYTAVQLCYWVSDLLGRRQKTYGDQVRRPRW